MFSFLFFFSSGIRVAKIVTSISFDAVQKNEKPMRKEKAGQRHIYGVFRAGLLFLHFLFFFLVRG